MALEKVAHNLIDASLEVFEKHQRKRGVQTDDVSFVGGFMSCYGIMTGRMDVGLAPDTSLIVIFDRLQRDLEDYRTRVVGAVHSENLKGG